MTPTPVTFASPVAPAGYAWEATTEQVAARYGLDPTTIVRFDLNTSPSPPAVAARVLAEGRFDVPLSEYPPSDYRRLVEAAAAVYRVEPDEILVGAGADEVLDLCAKAFLPPSGTAVVPTPTYAMYRVLSEQRPATVVAVHRRPASDGWRLDQEALRSAAVGADLVWLCDPNNPTGQAEPEGSLDALLDAIAADAAAAGRPAPTIVVDEAYAEFVGRAAVVRHRRWPNVVTVRTLSKAYAVAGARVGFAIAARPTIARLEPYRPPGSVSVPSVAVGTAVLRDPTSLAENLARIETERPRLAAALTALGWRVAPSVTNFLLVDFEAPARAAAVAEALLRRGLVPRTFGAGHVLAGCLRFTVRASAENDRLVEAARAIAAEMDAEDPTGAAVAGSAGAATERTVTYGGEERR
ncbi:MAG TPA: histidinol-phosphate transaminase [Candidatus Binatia bacterium]|nr:histidinol-phosphate transaminase [Candidatus Binatia bacterium]